MASTPHLLQSRNPGERGAWVWTGLPCLYTGLHRACGPQIRMFPSRQPPSHMCHSKSLPHPPSQALKRELFNKTKSLDIISVGTVWGSWWWKSVIRRSGNPSGSGISPPKHQATSKDFELPKRSACGVHVKLRQQTSHGGDQGLVVMTGSDSIH